MDGYGFEARLILPEQPNCAGFRVFVHYNNLLFCLTSFKKVLLVVTFDASIIILQFWEVSITKK